MTRRSTVVAVGIIAFGVFRLTLAPSVLFVDSGELAAVATTLGIAHPTGYPLFTLIGWVFAHLPIGGTPVYRLNVMAAMCGAAGAGMTTLLTDELLSRAVRGSRVAARAILVASAFAGLMLACSATYWAQATAVEVYALHGLLVPVTIYGFLKYCSQEPDGGSRRWGMLWALAWGLAFANHMTTILLAPAFLWFFFRRFGWTTHTVMRGIRLLVPFAAGLAVYLYLPIRAAMAPSANWGNPVTFESFLRHVTGRQYQVWMFSSWDVAARQLGSFFSGLPTEFGMLGLIPILVGIAALWRASRALFAFVLVLFATCVLYAINYDIHDIGAYFLLAYLSAAILCGAGALSLLVARTWRRLAVPALALMLIVNAAGHVRANNDSGNYLVHDYAINLLEGLPVRAIVITWQWDFLVSASMYFQEVEALRPDVTVVDTELLRRSWYLDQLRRNAPALYDRSRSEIDAFRPTLLRFERSQPYDPATIDGQYRAVIRSLVDRNSADRPIFVTVEVQQDYTAGYLRIPEGLAFRLSAQDAAIAVPFPQWRFRDVPVRSYYTDKVREMYMTLAASRGQYLKGHGQCEEAGRYFGYALTFAPRTAAPAGDPTAASLARVTQQIDAARQAPCRPT